MRYSDRMNDLNEIFRRCPAQCGHSECDTCRGYGWVPIDIDYEAAQDYNTRIDVQYPEEVVEMVNRALGIEDPGSSTGGP